MITKETSKIIKYTFIFACIILWSCEKETADDSNKVIAKPDNTKYLNAEELPKEFQDYFIKKNTSNIAKSNGNENNLGNAIFTEYDIISMTDDKNITNYSISFYYPDTPENIFYNLVINVLPTGENSIYIFKYICNPEDFQNFKSHNFDFKYFVGITEISLATISSNGTLTSKMNSGDEDCPKIYIPTPNSGSNSGAGAAGGGGDGSSGSSGYNTSVPGYNSPGHTGGSSPGPSTGGSGGSGGHNHAGCYGSNGRYWYFAGDVRPPHSHNEKKATDCPDLVPPSGNVPVITMPMIKVLGKELALSFDQIVFLRDKPDLMNVINQYLEENNFSEKSKDFAKTKINAARIEEQIDVTNLDPCTTAVFEKLKNLKQGDIANMLTRFAPAISIFNINISTGIVQNNDPNTWAQTTPVSGSNTAINMIFNQDYINGKDNPNRPTDLSVATTMAHEVIHAYLISLLEDNKTCGSSEICDFPTIYDAYVQQQINKNPNILPYAHHDLIAEKYVDAIAAIIQEYHTGQPVISGFPYQVYRDMAWGGLQGTTIFNKNYPNDPTHKNYKDRERIFARINTEKKGEQYGDNLPIGTPCKN